MDSWATYKKDGFLQVTLLIITYFNVTYLILTYFLYNGNRRFSVVKRKKKEKVVFLPTFLSLFKDYLITTFSPVDHLQVIIIIIKFRPGQANFGALYSGKGEEEGYPWSTAESAQDLSVTNT